MSAFIPPRRMAWQARNPLLHSGRLLALSLLLCLPIPAVSDTDAAVVMSQQEWLARASGFEQRRDWHGLRDWGKRWSEIEPANANAWFVLARALSKLNDHAGAIAAYRRNLELAPRDIFALINLGNLYRDGKQYRSALSAYRAAAQINPDYIPAWHNLGLTLYGLKGMSGVTQSLLQLRLSDPVLADAWQSLAIEYTVTRDPRVTQRAIRVLRSLDDAQRQRMFDILFGKS
jgi:tetratricopeptide (TPR) repeat protein